MTQVIFVRHGETEWNKERRVQGGSSDIQLNENGREQAERLALRLKSEKIEAIYSSPLHRALDTALKIAGYHGLEVTTEAELKELNAGSLEGVTLAELGRRLDDLLALPANDAVRAGVGEVARSAGGESLAELQQRAWGAVQRIVARHPDAVVVVVSHYFVILSIICAALDLPLTNIRRLRMAVGGMSTILFEEPPPRLILFNDTCHLNR